MQSEIILELLRNHYNYNTQPLKLSATAKAIQFSLQILIFMMYAETRRNDCCLYNITFM